MLAVGDVNAAPAAERPLGPVIEPLQSMQIVQVPLDRSLLAVDLESVEGLVAAGIARGFEQPKRAILEAAEERAGIIDAYLFHLAREVVLPLLDKRLGHGRDIRDAAVQPDRRINAVR